MKKLTTLLLAAGMVFAASAPASAVDVKMDGTYLFQFSQGAGAKFDNTKFDRETQYVRIGMNFAVSEQLSGYMQMHSKWNWGGTQMSADANPGMYMRQAYVDWLIPSTDVKVRMGRQLLAPPALADGKNVAFWGMGIPADGIAISAPVADWLNLSAWWARVSHRNQKGWDTHFSNALDLFTLAADIKYFDGFRIQPFFMFASQTEGSMTGDTELLSQGYGENIGVGNANNAYNIQNTASNNTYWLGITGDMTYFDPFTAKLSFMYGDRDFRGEATELPSQHGYFMEGLVSYKTAYGTPELLAFYGSGDDDNVQYAYQENMPSIVGRFKGSYGFFNGSNLEDNVLSNNHTGMGVWGVRAAWKNISFIEDLSHEFAVMYAQGTNSSDILTKKTFAQRGEPNRYMTTDDSVVELDFSTTYKIYKNLTAYLEAAYIFENFETGADKGRADKYDNAWELSLQFTYQF